jgi:hypothetical protein
MQFLKSIQTQSDLDDAICTWNSEKLKTGRSKLFYWLPKLTIFAKNIYEMNLTQIFITAAYKFKNSFNDNGDTDYSTLIGIDNELQFDRLSNEIMKNIKDEHVRFDITKNAITESDNISAIADNMLRHATSHGLSEMKDQIKPTITKDHYLELEQILLGKIVANTTRIHEYYAPMRLLQFIYIRAKELYNTIMKRYIDSDEDFIQLLEQLYSNVSSSSKGVFPVISTWSVTQYIKDDEIVQKMQSIRDTKPELAVRAEKIIDDISKAKKFRNMQDIDDE